MPKSKGKSQSHRPGLVIGFLADFLTGFLAGLLCDLLNGCVGGCLTSAPTAHERDSENRLGAAQVRAFPRARVLSRPGSNPKGLTAKIRNGALRLLQCVLFFGVCDE
jgi:hypothetical protein